MSDDKFISLISFYGLSRDEYNFRRAKIVYDTGFMRVLACYTKLEGDTLAYAGISANDNILQSQKELTAALTASYFAILCSC